MRFLAHSLPGRPEEEWHDLADHLEDVAAQAANIAAKWGASEWGRAAGLLHDIGKYSAEFQARVRGAPHQVDHSTAGAQLAVERYGPSGRLLAHLICGHHGGMADGACDDAGALMARLGKRVPRHAAWVDEVVVPAGLDLPRLSGHPTARPTRVGMALSHFGRMVFSALIDADRSDTEAFYAKACGYEIERGDWPSLGIIARQLNTYMAELAGDASDTPVNRVRAEILGQVRCRTGIKRGAASLTFQTGGV
jgi:CRISPR-associated endonuclease/helicase Cas3